MLPDSTIPATFAGGETPPFRSQRSSTDPTTNITAAATMRPSGSVPPFDISTKSASGGSGGGPASAEGNPAKRGGAAERGGGRFRDVAARGDGEGAEADGAPPHDERQQERGDGRDRQDDRVARHESGPPAHVPASSGYGVYFEQRRGAAAPAPPPTGSSPPLRTPRGGQGPRPPPSR